MKTKGSDHRFTDDIAQEYELITLAYPGFETFQQRMVDGIDFYRGEPGDVEGREPFQLLEIGSGDGFATEKLVRALSAAGVPGRITAIDIDASMVDKAREYLGERVGTDNLRLQQADALAYLQDCPEASYHAVASSFTLHNFEATYRREVEKQIHRVLRTGGLYTNADKYSPGGQEQFDALARHVDHFFAAFVPRGKTELLRKWVMHNISDQSPRHVMFADETVSRLEQHGFRKVTIEQQSGLQAILRAFKG